MITGPESNYVNKVCCVYGKKVLYGSKFIGMKMSRFLRFGLKAGIMSSAVYITIDKGVWKDSDTTGELYEELQKQIKPYVRPLIDQIPFDIPKLPRSGDMISTAKTAWNKGVMASSLFLVELPELTWDYVKRGSVYTYEKINEQIKALSEVENNQKNETKPTA